MVHFGEASALCPGGCGFDTRPSRTKDFNNVSLRKHAYSNVLKILQAKKKKKKKKKKINK